MSRDLLLVRYVFVVWDFPFSPLLMTSRLKCCHLNQFSERKKSTSISKRLTNKTLNMEFWYKWSLPNKIWIWLTTLLNSRLNFERASVMAELTAALTWSWLEEWRAAMARSNSSLLRRLPTSSANNRLSLNRLSRVAESAGAGLEEWYAAGAAGGDAA